MAACVAASSHIGTMAVSNRARSWPRRGSGNEGLKEKGALMLISSTAVESMGVGGLLGAAALRQQSLTANVTPPDTVA